MKYSDRKLLGYSCIAAAFVPIFFALLAYFYEERRFWGLWVVYPYRDLAFPLVSLGLLFGITGFVLITRVKRAKQEK